MAAVQPARDRPPATRSATAAIAEEVEILQSHLEYVLDERLGALNEDQRRFLDIAARHGRLLARLSEDLETLALAEVGRLEPQWAPCDLAAIAEDALRGAWPLAALSHKQIELRAPEPVWVLADAKQLHRAAVELFELAVRSAAPEGVVRAFAGPVALQVSYQGEPPAEDDLTLALVRAVASAHSGCFALERQPDGSVRLSLSLVLD